MPAFDPAEYENMVVEGANDTSFTPIPDGIYSALVDTIKITPVETKNGPSLVMRVTWDLFEADEELKKLLNREKVTVRQDIWLERTEAGTIALGRNQNIQLGVLRKELGMNDPNKKWFPKMLEGAGPAKIKVSHRDSNDGSGRIYNDCSVVETKKN